MANEVKKSAESSVVKPVQNGESLETTISVVEDKDGQYKRSFTARHIHVCRTDY